MITNEKFENNSNEYRTALGWSATGTGYSKHTVTLYEMRKGLIYVTWRVEHLGDSTEAGKFTFEHYNDARDHMGKIISAIVKLNGGREELADPDLPTKEQMQAMAEWAGANR